MSDASIPEQQQWDIERYLLDEPSLDRDEFEIRMLEDERLALAVAETVLQMQTIGAACRVPLSVAPSPSKSLRTTWQSVTKISLALTASLLVFVLFRMNNQTHSTLPEPGRQSIAALPADGMRLRAVAEKWIALDAAYEVDEASDGSSDLVAEPVLEVTVDDGDWMLQAAKEFFQELES